MKLGAFSVSLVVKDLQASRDFYEALGFEAAGGEQAKGWLVMRDGGGTVIGLFRGMFEKNMLTFNPGWDQFRQELTEFTDVRELQRQLKAKGIALTMETDESGKGPGYLMTVDPDGNPILIDQHV